MSKLIGNPAETFERVYVVNLDRRPDRWRRFAEGLPSDWPFVQPERFSAVDGQKVTPPSWWRAGRGAWGVYRSFFTILERCMNEGVRSVLMLEDDALFCDGFSKAVTDWLRHVPTEWGMLYLGGQHCAKAQKLNDWLVQPQNVNRCHAWAVNRPLMQETYDHLSAKDWGATSDGKAKHIDHHLGVLHGRHFTKLDRAVLCPPRWFIGQAAGASNICGKDLEDRFWKNVPLRTAAPEQVTRPVVIVLGPYRGGTSCVAGVLHRLGVSMGHTWSNIPANPLGTYEATALAKFCRESYQEWKMTERTNRFARIAGLREWGLSRQRAIPTPAPIGAKHPALCLMVPEILEAWPNARFVVVERDVQDVVRSFHKTGWCKNSDTVERLPRLLTEARDRALAEVPSDRVLRVAYTDVLDRPEAMAIDLARFAGVSPTTFQLEEVKQFVQPRAKIGLFQSPSESEVAHVA